MQNNAKKAVIVCGPTASGKTEFAHRLAIRNNGQVINADSMQIYKQLPIITASPEQALKNDLSYHLYNFQDVDKEFSAAKYAQMASSVVKSISESGELPVIVGGSGMYINMLVNGYNAMPDITIECRENARSLYQDLGAKKFFQELERLDPEVAKKLNIADKQRVLRAYEIVKQTGSSILHFQSAENVRLLPDFDFQIFFLLPERSFLYENCNSRLKEMFKNGAIEEVNAVYKKYGKLQTTAMKALGVAEIISYLEGDISIESAIEFASIKTRQYAKRQTTWFKHQLQNKHTFNFNDIKEYKAILSSL